MNSDFNIKGEEAEEVISIMRDILSRDYDIDRAWLNTTGDMPRDDYGIAFDLADVNPPSIEEVNEFSEHFKVNKRKDQGKIAETEEGEDVIHVFYEGELV